MSNNNTLDQWLAKEQEVLARLEKGPGPGLAQAHETQGKTGLQVMQAILDGHLPYAHIAQSLDFTLVEVAEGRAVFQGQPLLRFYNPLGTVHGGWIATMLDSALGCAVHTRMPVGMAYTTGELSVNYVKGLSTKVQRVRAEGEVIHCGRQLATAQARLVGPDGTLYAHGTTTCLVFPVPAAKKA